MDGDTYARYQLITIHVGFIATAGTVNGRSPRTNVQNSKEGSRNTPK